MFLLRPSCLEELYSNNTISNDYPMVGGSLAIIIPSEQHFSGTQSCSIPHHEPGFSLIYTSHIDGKCV